MAKRKCEQYDVDVSIYSVPLSDLNNTLKQFKYGFIVRDDIAVNNVATPTKMNSPCTLMLFMIIKMCFLTQNIQYLSYVIKSV